jgi:hypothetical protein
MDILAHTATAVTLPCGRYEGVTLMITTTAPAGQAAIAPAPGTKSRLPGRPCERPASGCWEGSQPAGPTVRVTVAV